MTEVFDDIYQEKYRIKTGKSITKLTLKQDGNLINSDVDSLNFSGSGVNLSSEDEEVEAIIPGDSSNTLFLTVGFSFADYICDGVDDDVQINAAINAVYALGGGTVFVKAGTYDISTATLKVKSNVQFCGEGNITVLKRNSSSGLVGVFTPSGSGSISNFSLKNFKVDCNETTVVANHFGITIGFSGLPAEYFKVENVTITKSSKGALQLSNCHYFEVCGITQDSANQIATADAIDLNLNCHHFDIHDIKMKSGDDGVVCAQSWYGTINNVQNEGSATGGAVRISGQATASHDITVTNIFALNCNNAFIVSNVGTFSQQCYDITASNIIGVGCDRAVAINCSDFMQDGVTLPFRNVVISNIIAKDCNYGLHIDSRYCVDGLIINNFISQGALVYGMLIQSSFNMQLSHIDISDSVDSGIRVNIINGAGYLKNLTIKDATLRNNGGRGLHVGPTTFFDDNAHVTLEDIRAYGNTLSGVEVSGAHFYMDNIKSFSNSQMGIRFNTASGYGNSYVKNSYLDSNIYGLYMASGAEAYVYADNISTTGNSSGAYNTLPVYYFNSSSFNSQNTYFQYNANGLVKGATNFTYENDTPVVYNYLLNKGTPSLLTNSSFETFTGSPDTGSSNTFTGWTNVITGVGGFIEATTSNVVDGLYAVRMYRAPGTSSSEIRGTTALKASTVHTFSYYGMTDPALTTKGACAVEIFYDNGSRFFLQNDGSWSTTPNDISSLSIPNTQTTMLNKTISFTSDTFAGNYTALIRTVNADAGIYIDAVSLFETALDIPHGFKLLNTDGTVRTQIDTGRALFGTGIILPLSSKTTTYTATLLDHTILCDAISASFTVNLPPAASSSGQLLTIKKTDASANTITIDGDGSETIDGVTTKTLTTQWEKLTIQSNGSAWFII